MDHRYVGDIAEILAYDRALTGDEVDAVHAYLKAHWSLP
jgi:hypothetical protein